MVLEQTDRELVEGCQRGEREAFRALFEKYKNKVYSIAMRYGGDADTATLRRIAEASNGALYVASNPATINDVFTAVVSNF